jgi:hypothetical protein
MKGRMVEAEKVLKMTDPGADINSFIAEIRSGNTPAHENIFMKKYRPALMLAFFIAFFNQFSGINASSTTHPGYLRKPGWQAVRRC